MTSLERPIFVVTDATGGIQSRHRKWERAIDRAVTLANKCRGWKSPQKYEVRHQIVVNHKSTQRLFSTSIYTPNLKTGGGCIRTTFTEYSKSIRYVVVDEVDRIPHDA